ncbi:MAG: cytochrome c [Thermoanaerobaculia bacterium]
MTRRTMTGLAVGLAALLVAVLLGVASAQDNAGFAVAKGRTTFRTYCASCHGEHADGHGAVAQYLTVPPADLTAISERYGEFPTERIRQIIDGREEVRTHGNRDMPVWGDIFGTPLVPKESTEDPEVRSGRIIDELVHYLQSIQATD